ncbi:uncharacterized protein LOC119831567 [Zerene cesonia]|uniref:uncharacterized protein LOC119831567 n=1 Tax=Zerene cesonia TaxID=33412 RepID=UPI0018E4EB74|nr:uncharacterized protein LOC119831567 [Zerene cesonia]XP_038210903.1 uncharacterized protein LOC119831567 [Zerene cesonia]XP_038210905.1 uncharacterized protein LOC119831567 [Zerene cesonia]
MSTKKRSLDLFLAEIFKEFIALKVNDLKKAQEVFKSVFEQVKQKMGEQCNYFNKYATQVLYAGSVYDGIKVSKLDEFDMDIVIRLPINYDDGEDGIIIENDQPGFVKLKICKAFDNLDKQKEWDTCHKVTREWRDENKYFLQNKFRQWMHSIVQKALQTMNGEVTVNNVKYLMTYRASGPAYTLNVKNSEGEEEFKLDVDLVPVIRFMLPRWPKGYRQINGSQIKEWLVVPKPNKAIEDEKVKNRCWRLSFQDYEREMMKDLKQLKLTIRLVKKLRDACGMKAIASYYIKTLFLWKIQKVNDKTYWQSRISVIFRDMIEDFYIALTNKSIPYFWNKNNNLIEGLKPTLQKLYADQLKDVLNGIDANDVEKVSYSLLTPDEIKVFKSSDFYIKYLGNSEISKNHSLNSTPFLDSQMSRDSSQGVNCNEANTLQLVKQLMGKVDLLTDLVMEQNERIKILEAKSLNEKTKASDKDKNSMEIYENATENGLSENSDYVDDLLTF